MNRALSVCAVAALLDACGGSQATISAPGATPQARIAASRPYRILYRFAGRPDGFEPSAGLINVGGVLYGTTYLGGAYGLGHRNGTAFTITPSGKEAVVYNFGDRADGKNPAVDLIDVDGTFYGTTRNGGTYKRGTVFRMTPDGAEKVLHSFGRQNDGVSPLAGLVYVKGTLYGTTFSGGKYYNNGTVFSVTTDGHEKVLHSFGGGDDGSAPFARLIYVQGKLYGTTEGGGGFSSHGTVFSITTNGTEKIVYSFESGADGSGPRAGLIEVNGTFYGTTYSGGAYRKGTVFSMSADGTESVLHSFGNGSDGSNPVASLAYVKGVLYGTTSGGGAYVYDGGTVFSVTTDGTETVLHSFGDPSDGMVPLSDLINVRGKLYGTTVAGGASGGYGTVFSIKP